MIKDVCMVHKNVDQSENLAVINRHMGDREFIARAGTAKFKHQKRDMYTL